MEVPLGDTFYFKFTTRAFATGVPTTLAGTPVVDIYEEANLTQITAAETLTVDYDSVTGLNDVAVVCSTGNGFEVGKYYQAVITTGTVSSVSVVGECVGPCFRIMPAEDAAAGVRDVNLTHIADAAVSTSTAQIGVNAVQAGGTAWGSGAITAASIAASGLNGKGDWPVGKTGYSLTATTGLGNQTADITGNLSGSVGSVTGAVGSVTGLTASNLDATVSSRMATTHLNATAGKLDGVALVDTVTTNTDMVSAAPTVAQILTTQMTESYAADGAAPTLAQALMLIQQQIGEFSISGTTLTVKKVDGATAAATFTLDDATSPSSITRAT